MTRAHVYRPGDNVRILAPKWIKRVGYPLVWTDLVDEICEDPRTLQAWKTLGFGNLRPDDLPLQFVRGIAMQHVVMRGFGGRDRTIIYHEVSEEPEQSLIDMDRIPHHGYVGRIASVYSKRVVKTGRRAPARGYGEDYEPPYLDDCKTHVLLSTIYGEIESIHVEPVEARS